MKSIKLSVSLGFHHVEIPAGTVIAVPAEIAFDFCRREVAIMVEPERAVIEPSEVRAETSNPIRRRGRPRKIASG